MPHGGPENDRERRDLSFDRYDRDAPCRGMHQIITGFSKWSDRYISTCSGQMNYSYQTNRMKKWRGILGQGQVVTYVPIKHILCTIFINLLKI